MKGTKKFFTLLIFFLFFIAVAFTSGCSFPIGGLQVDDRGATPLNNYIRAEPSRFLFPRNALFIPEKHVKVFGSLRGGAEEPIEITKVSIKIIVNPGMTGQREVSVDDNQQGRILEVDGLNIVVITYQNMHTKYHIEVGEQSTGTGNGSGGGGDGAGIVIIWNTGN